MKEFKSFLKQPQGGEVQRCFYSLKLDTYGCGCSNDCLYCYARSTLDFRKLWSAKEPSVSSIEKIKQIFNGRNKFNELFKKKVPIRLGGMTDCFSDTEKENKVTLETIKFLNGNDYPYLILTKNKLIAEYIPFLRKDLAYIQMTITTPYDSASKIMEPNASLTSERLESIKQLNDNGFYTAVRINPLFPMYRDGYFTGADLVEQEDKKLDYFDWSLIDMIADAGAKTVICGFLRLSSWNLKWIQEKWNDDLRWLFKEKKFTNGALHFSTEEKRYYYEKIKKICDSRGVAFSVCYDGDEEYEAFRYLWANQNDCCNGLGNVEGFKVTSVF